MAFARCAATMRRHAAHCKQAGSALFLCHAIFENHAMKVAYCQISKSGRLSLPAPFRKALGLEEGGRVIVELDDAEIRIRTQQQAIKRAQALYKRALRGAPGTSVDDFIAERREEAAREEAEYEQSSAKRK